LVYLCEVEARSVLGALVDFEVFSGRGSADGENARRGRLREGRCQHGGLGGEWLLPGFVEGAHVEGCNL
jgi:hypothetical protein